MKGMNRLLQRFQIPRAVYEDIFRNTADIEPSVLDHLTIPKGFYYGKVVNSEAIGFWKHMMVNALWSGVRFEENKCFTVLRFPLSYMLEEEQGSVEIANSVMDDKPVIKVTFPNRYYEMRPDWPFEEGTLLNIVRETNGDPLDINKLTPKSIE